MTTPTPTPAPEGRPAWTPGTDTGIIKDRPPRATATAFDIKTALDARARGSGQARFWPEITVPAPDGDLRLDGVELEWRYGAMWVHGYEIKVTRSDWLRDAKWERYRTYCDTLTLVCPKGMVGRDEMPGDIGLLWYDPARDTLRYRRKPGYETPGKDTGIIKDRLLRATVNDPNPGRYGRYATAREYADQKDTMRGVGHALGTRMAWRLQRLEAQCEPRHRLQVEAKAAAYDRLVNLLRDHGYRQIEPWSDPEHMDDALTELGHALDGTVPTALFDEETQDIIETLERMRARLGIDERKDPRRPPPATARNTQASTTNEKKETT